MNAEKLVKQLLDQRDEARKQRDDLADAIRLFRANIDLAWLGGCLQDEIWNHADKLVSSLDVLKGESE